MDISFTLSSWIVPTVITVVTWIICIVVVASESTGTADIYGPSVSVFGCAALVAAASVTIATWVTYAALLLFS